MHCIKDERQEGKGKEMTYVARRTLTWRLFVESTQPRTSGFSSMLPPKLAPTHPEDMGATKIPINSLDQVLGKRYPQAVSMEDS